MDNKIPSKKLVGTTASRASAAAVFEANIKLAKEEYAKAIKLRAASMPKPAYGEMISYKPKTVKKPLPKTASTQYNASIFRSTQKPTTKKPTAQSFADDKAKANLDASKNVVKSAGKKRTAGGVAKAIGKGAWKVSGGRVGLALTAGALAAGPLFNMLNKGASKGHMPSSANIGEKESFTSGRGGRAQGWVKDKAKPSSTTKVAKAPKSVAGTKYRVETGDTLSGIAKRAGVTLAELRAANPKIKDPRKIFRNTAINIPKKGTKPLPEYTGPVPYRPGSKASAAYEASRKKK